MDFANICRTCLYADTTLFSAFDPVVSELESSAGCVGVSAAEMLGSFTSVVITAKDQLSTKICTACLDQIHSTYTFKLKCESSQTALTNLLKEFTDKTVEESSQSQPPKAVESSSDADMQLTNTDDVMSDDDFSDLLKIPGNKLFDLNVSALVNEEQTVASEGPAAPDTPLFSIDFNLDSLNEMTKELETMDNIILEYGDPLAERKENPEMWIEELVECPGCHKEFRKIGLLRSHIVDVHMEGKLCKICNEEYATSIWKHISGHMPAKDFACADCDRSFHSQYNLQMHRKMAHEDFLTCEYCSMRFRNMQKFRDHVFQHTGRHEFQCDICLKVFKRKYAMDLHKKNHSGERSHECQHCSKTFSYKGNLKMHIVAAHGAEKLPFKCDICSAKFKNRPQLVKHKFEHNANPELQCDVCNEVFETKYKVELHKRKHTGEKPIKCEICGRGFRLKCHLKDHLATHSDDRPFHCKLCPSRYKRIFLLTRHVRKSHPECAKKKNSKSL